MGKTHLVISLDLIQDQNADLVGSKALSLARMTRMGFAVPTGFCVTGDAYREHLNSGNVMSQIKAALRKLEKAGAGEKNRILSDIRRTIVEIPLSEKLTEQIEKHYHKLAADRIAVRSSATAEDLPGHSFAGQYDTYLGIANLSACFDAVRKCWASLWTERAYEYRRKNAFDHLKVDMAVIVQSLISADASGVVFTADPRYGPSGNIVIEACFGLGQTLVSGKVTPDRFVVNRNKLSLLFREISEKKIECVLDRQGSVKEQTVPYEKLITSSLNKKQIKHLAKLAGKVEMQFRCPQDIEWSLYNNKIYLLQSRPITTLGTARSSRDRWIWCRFTLEEVMPDVVTPITKSLIDNMLEVLFDPVFDILCIEWAGVPIHGYFAGRVYFNASFWAAVIRAIPGSGKYDWAEFAGSNPDINKMNEIFENMTENDLPKIRVSRTRFVLKIPILIAGILSCTPRKGQIILAETKAKNQKREQLDISSMSNEQITSRCAAFTAEFCDVLGYAPYLFGTMTAYFGLLWVCERWFSDVTYAGRLLAGVGNMDDAQAAIDLWQLAVKTNELPELKRRILAGDSWHDIAAGISKMPQADELLKCWNDFMANHGHHCRAELELYNPRWSESPDYVLGLIRGYISCIEKTNPLENLEEITRQRRSFEQQCRRQLRNPVKRMFFNHFLVRSQNSAVFRENIKSETVKMLVNMRNLLIELGNRLHAANILADPDDIFFLKLEEIEAVTKGQAEFDVKNVIASRRTEYDKCNLITPPDLIVGSFDPDSYVPEKVKTDSQVLKGLAVSPGVATGKAKVILRTDSHTQLEAGEILVAPFTDPGWTPYFLPAAGIVMNQGSLLSHGSIVARELGLPAVVNVGHATKIIKTGQTIQVDGNRGVIKLLQ